MGIVEALKANGYKPEKSSEGEFQPLEGLYKVTFAKCEEVTSQRDQTKQLQVEFKVNETLDGSQSYSKYNEFRKYLALEGERATDKKSGVPFIINALFTAGYEASGDTDEALIQSIKAGLGTELFVRAWGWKPEDGEKTFQQFSVMKEDVAMKRAKKSAEKF